MHRCGRGDDFARRGVAPVSNEAGGARAHTRRADASPAAQVLKAIIRAAAMDRAVFAVPTAAACADAVALAPTVAAAITRARFGRARWSDPPLEAHAATVLAPAMAAAAARAATGLTAGAGEPGLALAAAVAALAMGATPVWAAK